MGRVDERAEAFILTFLAMILMLMLIQAMPQLGKAAEELARKLPILMSKLSDPRWLGSLKLPSDLMRYDERAEALTR
jgi:flagellar biosynthesis regulator FlbT